MSQMGMRLGAVAWQWPMLLAMAITFYLAAAQPLSAQTGITASVGAPALLTARGLS